MGPDGRTAAAAGETRCRDALRREHLRRDCGAAANQREHGTKDHSPVKKNEANRRRRAAKWLASRIDRLVCKMALSESASNHNMSLAFDDPDLQTLVRERIDHWRAGCAPDAATFLDEHPELRPAKSLVLDLILEEY